MKYAIKTLSSLAVSTISLMSTSANATGYYQHHAIYNNKAEHHIKHQQDYAESQQDYMKKQPKTIDDFPVAGN